jgi:hypothetical protein
MPPQQAPNGPQMAPGMGVPPVPPEVMQKIQALQRIAGAIKLLRDERSRGFRVDIEVDSTIFPDAAQEKQDRTDFITRVTQFIGQSMQMGAQMPEAIPLLGKLLLFGVRGYRIGRDLEMAIEEFTDVAVPAAQRHMQQEAAKPNPLMIKAQADVAKSNAQIEGIKLKTQSEQAGSQAEVQRQQLQNQGDQAQAQADIQESQLDVKMREMEMQIEVMRAQVEKIKAQAEIQKTHADIHQTHADIQQTHAQAGVEQVKAGAQVARAKADIYQAAHPPPAKEPAAQ